MYDVVDNHYSDVHESGGHKKTSNTKHDSTILQWIQFISGSTSRANMKSYFFVPKSQMAQKTGYSLLLHYLLLRIQQLLVKAC